MVRGKGSMRDKKKVSLTGPECRYQYSVSQLKKKRFLVGGAEPGASKLGAPKRRFACAHYGRGLGK